MENPKHKSLVGFFNSLDFEIQYIRNHQICIFCYSRAPKKDKDALNVYLIYYFIYCQNWLNLLKYNRHFGYITKLGGEKKC
jgi:hypothetical protein